jgi:HAD superfamily hydrolase (TIGR01509 family)
MLKAVIFDLDGILSDSEGVYEEATISIMGKFGIVLSVSELRSLRGLNSTLAWAQLAGRYSLPATAQELLKMEQEYIDTLMENGSIPPVPFAFTLIETLKEDGIKTAVATSNFEYRASLVLEQNNAEELIDVLVSSEKVENTKPAPDAFLLAADLLGVKPEECIVVEDSLIGVEAAKNAGMKVVLYTPEKLFDYEHCEADMILHSFEGVKREHLEECF